MRGVPPSTAAPVVAVPAPAAADPDCGGHGRPELLVTVLFCGVCDALPEPGAVGVVTIGGVPTLFVLPATDGGATALGLGTTTLGLYEGGATVGPIVEDGAVNGALAPDVPPTLPELDPPTLPELVPPALPPEEPVCANTALALASRQAADSMTR